MNFHLPLSFTERTTRALRLGMPDYVLRNDKITVKLRGQATVAYRISGLQMLVPGGGVEPPRAEARRILSPLRLPVPPSRRGWKMTESRA
jgi:hypothetical protein